MVFAISMVFSPAQANAENQLVRELKGFLDVTEGLIQKCHEYRQLHGMSKQYSPIKLRERKAKFTVVSSTATKVLQKRNQDFSINKKLYSS